MYKIDRSAGLTVLAAAMIIAFGLSLYLCISDGSDATEDTEYAEQDFSAEIARMQQQDEEIRFLATITGCLSAVCIVEEIVLWYLRNVYCRVSDVKTAAAVPHHDC